MRESNFLQTTLSTKSFIWDLELVPFMYNVKTLFTYELPQTPVIGGDFVEMSHYTASYTASVK